MTLHALLIACNLDYPGAWWWVGSVLLMLLFLFLLLLGLILPRDRAATEVPLQLAADTSSLGVIVLARDEQYEQINLSQKPIETAREQGLLWLPVTAENKGCFRLPLTGEECHFVVLYRCSDPEFDPGLPWLPYVFNIRRLPEP